MIVGSGNGGMPAKSSPEPPKPSGDDRSCSNGLDFRNRSKDEREIDNFLHTASMSSSTSSELKSKVICGPARQLGAS
jgi:hypothetical protein